ncbi:hypothetical protein PHYPSEUDO_000025 [Phytophthora pseudosyringae]|uniref:Uncharacterized protein n=1 Tax=Phytophthora pseudosyringae TaxID=221518 RepID=A0A8T1WN84_9STRA|nr:hypothetical protein PHYPSEUDO_000025 [Phytophthora pseudosyringae]
MYSYALLPRAFASQRGAPQKRRGSHAALPVEAVSHTQPARRALLRGVSNARLMQSMQLCWTKHASPLASEGRDAAAKGTGSKEARGGERHVRRPRSVNRSGAVGLALLKTEIAALAVQGNFNACDLQRGDRSFSGERHRD